MEEHAGPYKTFSWEEVHRHGWPSDSWVVVDDKVYDITAFVPNHPGGPRLWTLCGGDITVFFSAMHPPRVTVERHLTKYFIGIFDEKRSKKYSSLRVSDQYQDLRSYVWANLSKHLGVQKFADVFQSPKTWALWYPACTVLYFAGLVAVLYLPKDIIPFWARILFAVLVGILAAHVSFIIHDASHYRMRNFGVLWCLVLGDMSGYWTHAFYHEHLEHHRTLGDSGWSEPDIFDNMPFLRHREIERYRPWHQCQHIYFPIGWATFLLKSAVIDFERLYTGWGKHNSKRDTVALLFCKTSMVTLIMVSIYLGPFKWETAWELILLLFILFGVAGCLIGLAVGVVHLAANSKSHKAAVLCKCGNSRFDAEDGTSNAGGDSRVNGMAGASTGDFMECVIQGTLSIVPRLELLNFFTLGLAYHVEHHLFPSVPYWLLPRVNELVSDYCALNGIRINNRLSFSSAYAIYRGALWELGHPNSTTDPTIPPHRLTAEDLESKDCSADADGASLEPDIKSVYRADAGDRSRDAGDARLQSDSESVYSI